MYMYSRKALIELAYTCIYNRSFQGVKIWNIPMIHCVRSVYNAMCIRCLLHFCLFVLYCLCQNQ